jgi:cell division protein FtsB
MKNIFKSIKEGGFWKWVSINMQYVMLLIIGIISVSFMLYTATTADTLKELKDSAEKIDKLSVKQTATITSLAAERSVLQEKVKRLEGRKMQEKDNIKNYILTYYKTVAPIIAEEMAIRIIEKSTIHNVPFVAVIAVTEVESHFNPFAISKKGARGPMQVMPKYWLKEFNLPNKYALHDIETGIDCGVRVLRRYLDVTDNDMRKALYKYVGGDHNYIKRVYESMGKFIVFKSFTDIKVSAEENELNTEEEKSKTNVIDNDKIESKIDIKKKIVKSNIMFTHVIKKGQLLGDLARWYTGSINNWPKIAKANPTIIPNKMPIGSVITIPTKLLKNTTPME